MAIKRIFAALCACAAAASLGATAAAQEQETLYGIGSTSKVFTAAATLRLRDEGLLDLDAPLTEYLPEFTMADERYRQITPRMLLDHSSGLQGSCYQGAMLLGDGDNAAHDQLLEHLSVQRLKADPGAFSVYCNDGFSLAEQVVERVSGMSFTAFLADRFWEPMGLRRVASPESAFDRAALAAAYDGGAALPPETLHMIGSGGLYATAEDLCRYAAIFTRGHDGSILSAASAREMERPVGKGGDYGLGWDSVRAAPFEEYGITALSKGGDTNAYHAGLTVLPEENLSCAVLSSGGSSGACDAAAREILLAYLRETGRIPEAPPAAEGPQPEAVPLGPDAPLYEGWYVSRQQAMQVTADGDDGILLATAGTSRDSVQRYEHIGDGVFRSTGVGYLSPEGKLVEAQDGTRGETALTFREERGTLYLHADTTQVMPGLGETAVSAPMAQRVEPVALPDSVAAAWEARMGRRYYLTGERHTSAFYLQNPTVCPRGIDGLPGYVCLDDSGPCALLDRIEDENSARFFQQIPVHAGRDLSDIRFDGGRLDTQSFRFLPEEEVAPLGPIAQAQVGAAGDTLWYAVPDEGMPGVAIAAPENGNYFVYTVTRDGLRCTASSLYAGEKRVNLPAGGRVAFAGEPGARFTLDWEG